MQFAPGESRKKKSENQGEEASAGTKHPHGAMHGADSSRKAGFFISQDLVPG